MINVVIVDDHAVFSSTLIKQLTSLKVVGVAKNDPSAVKLIKKKKPDIVLLDPAMPLHSHHSILADIKSCCGEVKILILTMRNSAESAQAAFDMGASGYCLKDEGIKNIRSAVSLVTKGEKYISPFLTGAGE